MEQIIWTIGHSTRTWDEFTGLLRGVNIKCLADIRSLPGSNRYPHFNRENLETALPDHKIQYVHLPQLGGRRKAKTGSKNTGWRLDAFRGYADYMETPEFADAVKELEKLALQQSTAYMCAESLWWRCHRSLVSDYLKWSGWQVMHIMGVNKTTEHTFTSPARIINGRLSYP